MTFKIQTLPNYTPKPVGPIAVIGESDELSRADHVHSINLNKETSFLTNITSALDYAVSVITLGVKSYTSLVVPEDFESLINAKIYLASVTSAAVTFTVSATYGKEDEPANMHTASGTFSYSVDAGDNATLDVTSLLTSLTAEDELGISIKVFSGGIVEKVTKLILKYRREEGVA